MSSGLPVTARAIVDAAIRAELTARIGQIEERVAKQEAIRKAARQAGLRKILDGILTIEEQICKLERGRGEADRVPIAKMPGLTPAQQLAELNNRTALRKGVNGHGHRSPWAGIF